MLMLYINGKAVTIVTPSQLEELENTGEVRSDFLGPLGADHLFIERLDSVDYNVKSWHHGTSLAPLDTRYKPDNCAVAVRLAHGELTTDVDFIAPNSPSTSSYRVFSTWEECVNALNAHAEEIAFADASMSTSV